MNWQTNSYLIALRGFARKLGVTRILGRFLGGRSYEEAFDKALFSYLQAGDTVWDVGANIGYYTSRFAEVVGPSGSVVAFEPFPVTAARLRGNIESFGNCQLLDVALGAEAGIVMMEVGEDDIGATNRIVGISSQGVEVTVATGDEILVDRALGIPNVLKIDTEGFELDVLRGMPDLIAAPGLRALFIEVHFGLLAERGMASAPADIENLLKAAGFTTRWIDPSHIAAVRS
ncbi:FkbM family methyltransferase [Haliea sp. E1-2-M8]|uniref:FkbM family methyltransferase n=1 Tax=Haliea sp. E1-2-M8 TaxID=3064706 RepID=UPI00271C367E|nr:FkbM family methyltransferase [Haliea sp. E1-2-M8]MDO8864175.1 FkbM family methyltransferase [Haliea sp. E1-2-M8]